LLLEILRAAVRKVPPVKRRAGKTTGAKTKTFRDALDCHSPMVRANVLSSTGAIARVVFRKNAHSQEWLYYGEMPNFAVA
jgi:hypothetical protein